MKKAICFYLHMHQPFRINKFSIFDLGSLKDYFDQEKNFFYLERIVKKSYLPTIKILKELIFETKGKFKISLSVSGTLLEQLERHFPKVIEELKNLLKTKKVELLCETYYHSLSWLYSKKEFKEQIKLHQRKIKSLFKKEPKVFRNTELMLSNEIAKFVQKLGFKAILGEGADDILEGKSPNFLYQIKGARKIKILLRNYRLSDDISFRFSRKDWEEWPLTCEKFASWIENSQGEIFNLFMDFETFGEHQWQETGIFEFLKNFPKEILKRKIEFMTPSEIIEKFQPKEVLNICRIVTWADTQRDLSAWLENEMQKFALEKIAFLEKEILKTKDQNLIETWRKLQTSDHFYYMCTKWFADGDVHKYFNPYESPYDCFISFMNILTDLKMKLKGRK